jgi:hypothetical protein
MKCCPVFSLQCAPAPFSLIFTACTYYLYFVYEQLETYASVSKLQYHLQQRGIITQQKHGKQQRIHTSKQQASMAGAMLVEFRGTNISHYTYPAGAEKDPADCRCACCCCG